MSDFENLLRSVLSPQPDARLTAENTITAMLAQNPSEVASNLLIAMGLPDEALACLAAVLFRRKIICEDLMPQMSPACRQSFRGITSLFVPDRSINYLKNLADVTLHLAISEQFEGELLNCISQWINSEASNLREVSIYVFRLATDYPTTITFLTTNMAAAIEILTRGLADPDLSIKVAAVESTACFLGAFDNEQAIMQYATVTSTLLAVTTEAVQALVNKTAPGTFEDRVKTAITSLSNLSQAFGQIWHQSKQELTVLVCNTAKTKELSKEVRSASVDLILTTMMKAPGLFKADSWFIQEMLAMGLMLLSEIEHAHNIDVWNTEDNQDTGLFTNEPYSLGKEILAKLAVTLKGENVLPHIMQLLPIYLSSEDWVRQHVGIITIGMVAEGCHDMFATNYNELFTMVLPFTSSPQPRLRWAACTTIGLICSEFQPEIELNGHDKLVPAISNCLIEGNMLRVQTQAALCLINFVRGLEESEDHGKACLIPYLPNLLQVLFQLMTQGVAQNQFGLLIEAMNALSAISTLVQEDLGPFYAQFMPGLTQVAGITPADTLQAETRAAAIRCIGNVVEACAQSCGTEEANRIFTTLMGMLGNIPYDDPAVLAIKEASVNFAAGMKEVFAPFMQPLMTELIKDASSELDLHLTDTDNPNNPEVGKNMEGVRIDLPGLGTKQITINTTALETKIKAVKILYDLVTSLEKNFSAYVEATLQVLEPLFDYQHNDDIRKFSLKTASKALHCFDNSEKAEAFLRIMFPVIRGKIGEVFMTAPKDAKRLIGSLITSCTAVPSIAVIGLPEAVETSKILASTVNKVFERKINRSHEKAKYQGDDVYYEELDILQNEDDVDDEIVRGTMEIIGHFLKAFKQTYQPTFTECFQTLYSQLFYKQGASDIELLSAVCIFDDYVEHTGDAMVENGKSKVLEQMIQFSGHGNADVRQSSAYGIGVCAQLLQPEIFSQYGTDSLKKLSTIINAENSRSSDNVLSTYCAIGALGKLAVYQNPDIIPNWLEYLPIQGEPEEAQEVHKLFLSNASRLKDMPKAGEIYGMLCTLQNEQPQLELLDEEGISLLAQAQGIFV